MKAILIGLALVSGVGWAQGIPMGPNQGPVVIHSYMDYMCSYCAKSFTTLSRLQRIYPNKVSWQLHQYPNPQSPASMTLSKLILCSQKESTGTDLWQLSQQLYALPMNYKERLTLSPKVIKQLGVSHVKAVSHCLENMPDNEVLKASKAQEAEIKGTPFFKVVTGKQAPQSFQGHRSFSHWQQVLGIKKTAD